MVVTADFDLKSESRNDLFCSLDNNSGIIRISVHLKLRTENPKVKLRRKLSASIIHLLSTSLNQI